jgi:CubicO group peptidase (beta-lactamase class C family)
MHASKSRLAVVLALMSAACAGPRPGEISTTAVEADPTLGARVDAAAADALREIAVAGFSVAVVRHSRPVLAKGYGYANLAERVPASATTIYRLASITKEFTAAAILHLTERGRLSLDDPIGDYLPDYPGDGRITIRQLLSHTSGLSDATVLPLLEESGGVGIDRNELIGLVAAQPLDSEPGSEHSYSNVGYILLGLLIERVTGTAYADYVENEILRPLGLDRTFQCPNEQRPDNGWAHGYDIQYGNWSRALRLGRPPTFIDPPPIDMGVVSSAGALCSTATDLADYLGELGVAGEAAAVEQAEGVAVFVDEAEVGGEPQLDHLVA